MSLLSGIVGGAESMFGVNQPDKGFQALNNPSTYIGSTGGSAPAPAPKVSTQSSPQPAAPTAPQSTQTGGGVNSTAGTYGYGMNQPEYLNGIQQEYGSSIQASQNQLNPLAAEYQQQVGNTNQLAQAQLNQLGAQYNGAMNTLDTQKQGTQAQQKLSLAELADQIRGQNQGLMNQLGANGAGFSSAVGQGQYGLAQAQNQSRANIQQQAGNDIANINAEEQATTQAYQPQVDQINAWKQGQLYQLMENYNNTMAQLQGAIGQAQGEEKARLAEFGQNLTQQTSSALQQLDQVTGQAINQVTQNLKNAPQPSALPTYQPVAPISVNAVSPFSSGQGTDSGNATAGPVGGSVYALLNNNKQNQ